MINRWAPGIVTPKPIPCFLTPSPTPSSFPKVPAYDEAGLGTWGPHLILPSFGWSLCISVCPAYMSV